MTTMSAQLDKSALRALLEAEVPTLSNYSVGFVLPTAANGLLDAGLGGSGTLVTIDNVLGILTARHVIDVLMNSEHVGLVLPASGKELHNLSFRSEECSHVSLALGSGLESGPDLGVFIPPPNVLATLQAKKSFYNMSKRRTRMLEKSAPLEHGLWVLSGFAGEWTGDGNAEQGFAKVKFFKGMHAEGRVQRECVSGDFDYLIFEALYNQNYQGPECYGGFSGGGLWQLLVKPSGDKFEISDRLLSGVAFYQSAKKQDRAVGTTREIKCHGRRSLYGTMIDSVRESGSRSV
jgi:hypothetical protein